MENPSQPQPGQPPPSQQPPSQAQAGQPPLAIISLVTGILGVFTFWCCIGWPAAITAIVTGILGRKQAPERGVSPTMATIGLALGIATIVFAIAWTVIVGFSGGFSADFDTS